MGRARICRWRPLRARPPCPTVRHIVPPRRVRTSAERCRRGSQPRRRYYYSDQRIERRRIRKTPNLRSPVPSPRSRVFAAEQPAAAEPALEPPVIRLGVVQRIAGLGPPPCSGRCRPAHHRRGLVLPRMIAPAGAQFCHLVAILPAAVVGHSPGDGAGRRRIAMVS